MDFFVIQPSSNYDDNIRIRRIKQEKIVKGFSFSSKPTIQGFVKNTLSFYFILFYTNQKQEYY